METVIIVLLGIDITLTVASIYLKRVMYKRSLERLQKQLVKAITELYRSKK